MGNFNFTKQIISRYLAVFCLLNASHYAQSQVVDKQIDFTSGPAVGTLVSNVPGFYNFYGSQDLKIMRLSTGGSFSPYNYQHSNRGNNPYWLTSVSLGSISNSGRSLAEFEFSQELPFKADDFLLLQDVDGGEWVSIKAYGTNGVLIPEAEWKHTNYSGASGTFPNNTHAQYSTVVPVGGGVPTEGRVESFHGSLSEPVSIVSFGQPVSKVVLESSGNILITFGSLKNVADDDVAVTTVDKTIVGNISLNDHLQQERTIASGVNKPTYSLPVASVSNPAGASLLLNYAVGTYEFTAASAGVYEYTVPINTLKENGALTSKLTITVSATPDLAPVVSVTPNTITGTATPFATVVNIQEVTGKAGSSGAITVRIPKSALYQLTFNGAATTIGGSSVQNIQWTFNNAVTDFYVLTSTGVIESSGKLSLGLDGTFTPGATSGAVAITATITAGSGSETNAANNTDAETITYFK